MGGESLIGQRTGVGQYTAQLSQHLLKTESIDDFKFLAHGALTKVDTLLRSPTCSDHKITTSSRVTSILEKMRGVAAQNQLAVWCYQKAIQPIEHHALKNYSPKDIFHSPNFMLPTFPGKRVVTILDLSTIRHPEFHPKARVKMVNLHINNAIKRADHIITISEYIRQEIIDYFGVPTDRITKTFLAASRSFSPMAEKEFNTFFDDTNISFKNYFLFVSTIEPRKNLATLLDAYLLYRRREGTNSLPLVIAGHPGWHSEDIHQRVRSLEKTNDIKYFGYVNQLKIPALFAGARGLLFPSIYEGFGLPVLEAMQAGTVVLTSRDSAMSEVSQNSAILVSPDDVDDMCDKICELANNDSMLRRYTSMGLIRSRHFSWERCADQTLSIYKNLAQ